MDKYGTIESVVTSNANNDSGMFETNLREERFLPFEGAGVYSTWKLELPSEFRQFDYNTISDVILHMRYTARQGGAQLRQAAVANIQTLIEEATTSDLVQLFSLRHDFPNEWHRFVTGDQNFKATVKKEHFPYLVQGQALVIDQVELYRVKDNQLVSTTPVGVVPADLNTALKDNNEFDLSLAPDDKLILERKNEARVFLLFRYSVD